MVQILAYLLLLLDEPIREDDGRHLRQQNIRSRRGLWIISVERGGAYDERGARGRRDASCEDAAGCSEHSRVDGVLHKLSAALVVMQCARVRRSMRLARSGSSRMQMRGRRVIAKSMRHARGPHL